MGMSKGQKGFEKLGVKSPGRGILGIWFEALSLETSRIKSYVNQAECKHTDCCNPSRGSVCLGISNSPSACCSAALQGGRRVKPPSLTSGSAKFVTVCCFQLHWLFLKCKSSGESADLKSTNRGSVSGGHKIN